MKITTLLFSAPLMLLAATANIYATTTLAVVMTNDPACAGIRIAVAQ